jgi:phenylalanyl-tRNA synthetase beta chain
MKFSLSWLKEHLETDAKPDELSTRLVQLGHELDGVEDQAARFDHVVVGRVQDRSPHPDADRLGVCTVDVGGGKTHTIVCGASNVRADLTVAVALPGAVLPGDFQIKKSKIRGVESEGMICSERELGLGEEHDGIWEMETDASPGTSLARAMGWDDVIFDVAVTPNRGDCLSVYGLARDLSAAGVGTLRPLAQPQAGKGTEPVKVTLETEDCSFFSGVYLRGIKNGPSPGWLRQRVEQAGLRPRSLVVDVTNYIMLTYGQPLHAYDADKLQGHISVQAATGGEKFKGIGEVALVLNPGDVTINDDSGIIGLGGILGGEGTAVDEKTTNVFLEAAWFERSRIARTGQQHQLVTDARYRFERGIDPAMTARANQLAADVILAEAGGERTEVLEVGTAEKKTATIDYEAAFCRTFGGLDVPATEQKKILKDLGFDPKEKGPLLKLTAPTWRTYMETPEDVVEEILRIRGYETVPAVLPPMAEKSIRDAAPTLALERLARQTLAGNGFVEVVTYSFIRRDRARMFARGESLLELDNPLDADTMTTMRPDLLPGLLEAAAGNMAHSRPVARLLELGTVFTATGERVHAAGVFVDDGARHWQGRLPSWDVFAAKAAALQVVEAAGVKLQSLQLQTPTANIFHPGRSGQLVLGKETIARFGEVHPKIVKAFDLKGRPAAFVVDLTALSNAKIRRGTFAASPYPPVMRDLAFVLDEQITAQDVVKTVAKAAGPLAKTVEVFDLYVGKGVPPGKKSLALALTLQADDRTLEDADITQVMDAAITEVKKRHKGELRT